MEKNEKIIFATLFFSLFSTVTGVGIVVPLLPVYAYDIGATGFHISLIFGSFALSRTLLLPFFGRQSDKKGRKPFIVWGMLFYTLTSFAFMYSNEVNSLIVLRFLQGIASAMVFPVVQAYIGDITTETREGFTMGLFNMSAFVGLSIGPLMGGFINEIYGLRAAFAIMGVMSGIGFFTNLFFLPPRSCERISSRDNLFIGWKTLLFQKPIIALFIYRFAFTACIGIVWGFLPVYASNSFSLKSSYIGILVTMGVFISGALQTPMGYVADRFNRKRMVIFGGLFISLSLIYFERSTTMWGLFFSNILFGLGGGISTAPHMALTVVAGNQNRAMGTVMSLMITGHSMGILIGSLLAGAAMDFFQLGKAFSMGAGVMIVGVSLFFILGHTRWGSAV